MVKIRLIVGHLITSLSSSESRSFVETLVIAHAEIHAATLSHLKILGGFTVRVVRCLFSSLVFLWGVRFVHSKILGHSVL